MHPPALTHIDLVAFDLDGTLIDSVPDLAAAVDAMRADFGWPPAGANKVCAWVGNGSRVLVDRALADAAKDDAPSALATIDSNVAHDAFLHHYHAAPCTHTRVYAGAHSCLETLHENGFTLALITNKPAAFLPLILHPLQIAHCFALTLGGDSLAQKKPHPAPLQHVAERLGTAPQRCLMVGDSRHDIIAGKAAGFRTLAVTYGYNHGEPIEHSNPDHIVDSLAELR